MRLKTEEEMRKKIYTSYDFVAIYFCAFFMGLLTVVIINLLEGI